MPTFVEMMNAMIAMQRCFPDMDWRVDSDGILKVDAYVGIANHDLYKQAVQMFATGE